MCTTVGLLAEALDKMRKGKLLTYQLKQDSKTHLDVEQKRYRCC